MSHRTLTLFVCVAWATSVSAQVRVDYLGRRGFTDPRHTEATTGYQSSAGRFAWNEQGFSIGASSRFTPAHRPSGSSVPNESAWLGSPWGGTKAIGLYDPAHKANSGLHSSSPFIIRADGLVVGSSVRFDETSQYKGRSLWLASWDKGTWRIGPTDSKYTESYYAGMDDAGRAIGVSDHALGRDAWIVNATGGELRFLGFNDPAHTGADGWRSNQVFTYNRSGTIFGMTRWTGGNQVAWLHSKHGGGPRLLGFYGEGYTGADGSIFNELRRTSARGHAIGDARFRDPDSGQERLVAWLALASGENVALRPGVTHDTSAELLTDSGFVSGHDTRTIGDTLEQRPWIFDIATRSLRFPVQDPGMGSAELVVLFDDGASAGRFGLAGESPFWEPMGVWFAPPGGPAKRIGFHGPEFESASGIPRSRLEHARPGLIVGVSYTADDLSSHSWLADARGVTSRIGLVDAMHTGQTSSEGELISIHRSWTTHITSSGFVAGLTHRYDGGSQFKGRTAWIYNSSKRRYVRFDLSVSHDGYSESEVHHLTESGIACGTYQLYSDAGDDLGRRPFIWVTGRGAYDLEEVLDVDLAGAGWASIDAVESITESGYILCRGTVNDDARSRGVFIAKLRNSP